MKTNAKISTITVRHVAQLAKLNLTSQEVNKFQEQLGKIFGYVDQIRNLSTAKIKETSQVTGAINRTREDKITPERILNQEEALSQAKRTHNGYFVVKAIL